MPDSCLTQSIGPQPRELYEALQKLSDRGRQRTEALLRKAYEEGNEALKIEAARFLFTWNSSRRFVLADEWMAQGPTEGVFDWIAVCYELAPGMTAHGRFLRLFERPDLTDVMTYCLIDRFGSYMECRRGMARREAIAIIARFGDHLSPEVRWTVAFRFATLRAKSQRGLLRRLTLDTEKCAFGFVSRVAKNALAFIDGDEDINLHDAREP